MLLAVGISSLDSFVKLLGVLVIFLLVLALSYVSAKWLGGSGFLVQRSRNISIVESYKLGPNKLIQIVKIGKRYYALGVGKDTVELLSEIPEDELNLEQYTAFNHKNQETFQEIFSKIREKRHSDSKNG